MTTAALDVQLHQIAYSAQTLQAIEPGYAVLHNISNPRPDWYEVWPIVQFLRIHALDEQAFYGFFSPKFGQKTGLMHSQVLSAVRASALRGADVVLFSPQPDMGAFFLNVFEQGETFDAGLIDALQSFMAHIGRPVELRALVMDSRQTVFSNYFVARPAFWRAWLNLVELFIAVCDDPAHPLAPGLTVATTYRSQAQRKVFIAERLASLLLAIEPHWRTQAADPFTMAWSASRFREYPHEAVISDALKIAHRENGFPEYLRAFSALRTHFSSQLPAIGQPSPGTEAQPCTNLAPASPTLPAAIPKAATSALTLSPGNCPVLVISYNNHHFVEHTVAQLRQASVQDIVVLDNASTWPESQRWLSGLQGCTLIRNPQNYGHLAWHRPEIFDRLPPRFAVTDPDLLFHPQLPADFLQVLCDLAEQLNAQKVGFALDIGDSEQMFSDSDYHLGQSIVEWERQFWLQPVRHDTLQLFLARIDTTFHVYNKTGNPRVHLRAAGNYTVKHLPWYRHYPVFGPARMTEIYRHGTQVSTIARLHLRHQGVAMA